MAHPQEHPGAAGFCRALFERMEEGCAVCEMVFDGVEPVDWIYLAVNPAFTELTGLGEVVGRRISELLPGLRETSPDLFAAYGRVAASGRPERLETFVRSLNRRLSLQVFSPGPGQFGVIFRDNTAEHAAREQAASSERQFRTLFQNAPLGMAIVESATGRFLAANPRLEQILGYSVEELLKLTFLDLTHSDHLPADLLSVVALASGQVEEVTKEKRYVHRSGRTVWVNLKMVRLPAEPGGPARHLGLVEDITGRKTAEAEQARIQRQLQLARTMESLGLLAAGVAHSINNVLAVAMGTASIREPLAADPSDREAYQSIGRACLRGREVVKSLIQFSRPTLASRAPFELHAIIQEVRALMDSTTGNRVRSLVLLEPEPVWIHGDAGSFNLALVNLCLNAVEAMPGGGTLTLRTSCPDPDWVEVAVQDSGRGMAGQVLEHVLDPFFTTKEDRPDAGLGLSMSYGVIKAHGGTMDIASEPERGTIVTLRVPRIPAPVQDGPAPAAAPPPALSSVLLVDDDEDVRTLMLRMLRKAGIGQVTAVGGGAEALAILRAGTVPDLVILDQNMPGMTGTQAMALIRELLPDLPILFSSGQPDIENWECLRLPGVAVISKPFTMEEIQAKLEEFGQARA